MNPLAQGICQGIRLAYSGTVLDWAEANVRFPASAIRDNLVDKQTFPHWQPGSRQLLYQTGYRQKTSVSAESKAPFAAPASIPGIPADLLPKVQDKILAHPHKTASAIKDLFSTNNRSRLSVKAIRSLLDKPSHNRK